MQGLWYGDRRDRVKWGALVHIAERVGVHRIVQVAYYRDQAGRQLITPGGPMPLRDEVWEHFSDLNQICRLGGATGTEIIVLDQTFDPAQRAVYVRAVISRLDTVASPKIVFLDPDTGVAAVPGAGHVGPAELSKFWEGLAGGDVLAVYQHGDRTNTWLQNRKATVAAACGGTTVDDIVAPSMAADVAILYCVKH